MAGKKPGVNAWELFQKTAKNLYDHVTLTIGMSAVWFGGTVLVVLGVVLGLMKSPTHQANPFSNYLAAFIFALAAGTLMGALVWGPLNCGLLYFAKKVQDNEARWSEFFQGISRNYGLACKVYAIFFFGMIFLLGDIYLAFMINNTVLKLAGVTAIYFAVFLLAMNFYIPGLIVFQENNTVPKILRKAYLLTLDNALTNVVAGVTLLIVASIFLVLPFLVTYLLFLIVSFAMFFGGFLLFYQSNLYHAVMERYDD